MVKNLEKKKMVVKVEKRRVWCNNKHDKITWNSTLEHPICPVCHKEDYVTFE